MSRRYLAVTVAVLGVPVLTGCAGFLLALALRIVSLGALGLEISDFIGRDSQQFTALVDGYDLDLHPDTNGKLNLTGLPVGTHLLSVVREDRREGWHRVVSVTSGSRIDLGEVNLIGGGLIKGRLQRQVGSGKAPLGGVRVAAILGGAELVSQATGTLQTLPPPLGASTTIMDYTDESGYFTLGPCTYGNWLVTAAYPGLTTDVRFCQVSGGDDARGQDLTLEPLDPAEPPGTIRGNVLAANGGPLAAALVNADLQTPLQPVLTAARAAALQSQAGVPLRPQPWCRWTSLATQSDLGGAYEFEVPAGTHNVYGFKYTYESRASDVSVGAGGSQGLDFELPKR